MASISIVVPSRNDAEILRGCLDSLAAQTRPPDEVIVVDNASDDDTAEVARAAGARVVDEPRLGVLHATAAGFDAARFEIVGRLDADSRAAPDWVEHVERRFDADPTMAALTGTGRFYDCNGFWKWVGHHIYLGGFFRFIGLLCGHVPLFGSNFAIRRDVWLAIRGRVHIEDPHVHDDLDISFVLEPGMAVDYDAALEVQVSGRPFSSWAGFTRRAGWAFHNIRVNWDEVGWGRRLRLCAAARRNRRAAAAGR